MTYRYRGINEAWVHFERREDAVASCRTMVQHAMTFSAAYVWHDTQVVAIVMKGQRWTDEQIRERHGRFVEVVRV